MQNPPMRLTLRQLFLHKSLFPPCFTHAVRPLLRELQPSTMQTLRILFTRAPWSMQTPCPLRYRVQPSTWQRALGLCLEHRPAVCGLLVHPGWTQVWLGRWARHSLFFIACLVQPSTEQRRPPCLVHLPLESCRCEVHSGTMHLRGLYELRFFVILFLGFVIRRRRQQALRPRTGLSRACKPMTGDKRNIPRKKEPRWSRAKNRGDGGGDGGGDGRGNAAVGGRSQTMEVVYSACRETVRLIAQVQGGRLGSTDALRAFWAVRDSCPTNYANFLTEAFVNAVVVVELGIHQVARLCPEGSRADMYLEARHLQAGDGYLRLQFKSSACNEVHGFSATKRYEGHLMLFGKVVGTTLKMWAVPWSLVPASRSSRNFVDFGTGCSLPSEPYEVRCRAELASKVATWVREGALELVQTREQCVVVPSRTTRLGSWTEDRVIELLNISRCPIGQLPFDALTTNSQGAVLTVQIRSMLDPRQLHRDGAQHHHSDFGRLTALGRTGPRFGLKCRATTTQGRVTNVVDACHLYVFAIVEPVPTAHVTALFVFSRAELAQRGILRVASSDVVVDGVAIGAAHPGLVSFDLPFPDVHSFLRARFTRNMIPIEYTEPGGGGGVTPATVDRIASLPLCQWPLPSTPQWLLDQESRHKSLEGIAFNSLWSLCKQVALTDAARTLRTWGCTLRIGDRTASDVELIMQSGMTRWKVFAADVDRDTVVQVCGTVSELVDEVVVMAWSSVNRRTLGFTRLAPDFEGQLRVGPPGAPLRTKHGIWVPL